MADSLFDDRSMLRRVHREWAVAFSGPRALLMQALHPVAWEGFFAHTASHDEPYERLNRTAYVMDAIAFGPAEEAERLTRIVRAMHRRTKGELDRPAGPFPAGTPYAADDPVLLLWILACLVDSALVVYQRAIRPLSRDEREAYWQEYTVIGELFGLERHQMPEAIEDFEAYMHDMLRSDDLWLSDEAREAATRIVLNPPLPDAARPLVWVVNAAVVGLLPERARELYGFSWDPARALALRLALENARRTTVPLLPAPLRFVPSARKPWEERQASFRSVVARDRARREGAHDDPIAHAAA